MKRKGLLAVTAAAALSLVASLVTTTSASAAVNCDPFTGYKGLKGKTVTIFTSILEPELTTLQTAWKDFSTCTGVKISRSKDQTSSKHCYLFVLRVTTHQI